MKNYQKAIEKMLERYTPEELAEKLGVSRASIFNWKGGHNKPNRLAVAAVLNLFKSDSLLVH